MKTSLLFLLISFSCFGQDGIRATKTGNAFLVAGGVGIAATAYHFANPPSPPINNLTPLMYERDVIEYNDRMAKYNRHKTLLIASTGAVILTGVLFRVTGSLKREIYKGNNKTVLITGNGLLVSF